jgi:hypothetical protein
MRNSAIQVANNLFDVQIEDLDGRAVEEGGNDGNSCIDPASTYAT